MANLFTPTTTVYRGTVLWLNIYIWELHRSIACTSSITPGQYLTEHDLSCIRLPSAQKYTCYCSGNLHKIIFTPRRFCVRGVDTKVSGIVCTLERRVYLCWFSWSKVKKLTNGCIQSLTKAYDTRVVCWPIEVYMWGCNMGDHLL